MLYTDLRGGNLLQWWPAGRNINPHLVRRHPLQLRSSAISPVGSQVGRYLYVCASM